LSPVLHGGLLADPARELVIQADLGISGGRIGGVPSDDAEKVDVSGCVVMPGNVCAHHHLYSSLARGMPGPSRAPRNFVEILELIWWRLDRALDAESIRLSALLGAVEAACAGTTSITDHHASPSVIDGSLDLVADAVQEAGLRAVVCYEVTDRHGEEGGRAGIAENARFLRTNRRPLVRGMAGAHASFTIGPATLDALVGAARDLGAPLHIHLAEDGCDQQDSLERYGERVVHRLIRAGALREGDLVAHGVHLDDSEIDGLVTSGAWVAHNPRSNMNNGVGGARASDMGERVALGTDGLDGDMFAEARACYLKRRESDLNAGPEWAQRLLSTGAGLVASVFGEPALGSLEAGAPADLIVLDPHLPTPLSDANMAGHLLFGMNASHVRDVMVAGRWIVRDRRHLLIDEASLAARCRVAAPELWGRIADGSGLGAPKL